MNCNEYLDRLDDVLAARLDAETAASMEEHRAVCADCRAEHDEAGELTLRVRQLPMVLVPARDLWPEIERRLETETVVRPGFGRQAHPAARTWWRLAAAAAVLIAAVAVAYHMGRRQVSPVMAQRTPAANLGLVHAGFEGAAILGLENQVETIRNQLLEVISSQDLDPETVTVVMDNLRVIDDAVTHIDRALAEDPGNPRLTRQLAFVYRQELDLLRRVTRLPADV